MKKIILLIALVSLNLSFSQRNKRDDDADETPKKERSTGYGESDIIFSGGFGFNTESTGNVKANNFSINPKFGLFLTDRFVLGAGLNYSTVSNENPFFGNNKTSAIGGGLFARFYVRPEKEFSFFFQLDGTFEKLNNTNEIGGVSTETKSTRLGLGISPAVSFFLSQNVAIEAGFGNLGFTSTKPENGDASNRFGLGFDLSTLKLGLTLKL